MPVGVLQVRPVGEIIQFHLFHQERPWHDVGRTHTQTQLHTLSQSWRHTHFERRRPGQRADGSVKNAKQSGGRREDCLQEARGEETDPMGELSGAEFSVFSQVFCLSVRARLSSACSVERNATSAPDSSLWGVPCGVCAASGRKTRKSRRESCRRDVKKQNKNKKRGKGPPPLPPKK